MQKLKISETNRIASQIIYFYSLSISLISIVDLDFIVLFSQILLNSSGILMVVPISDYSLKISEFWQIQI